MENRVNTNALGNGEILPDVRDGLCQNDRIVLSCLSKFQHELESRNVPTAMLYGRALEHINISVTEMQSIIKRLTGNTI